MQLFIIIHRSARCLDGMHSLVLRLTKWTSAGLFVEETYPLICFLMCTSWLSSAPWVIFFTRYHTPWIFSCAWFLAVSDLDIILRAKLRSWGSFRGSMSPTFWEGVPNWSEDFSNFSRASWLVFPIQYPWGIRSCCRLF